ncbi:hypothetical protein NPS01_25120 [Nocardioides psychrotolerans]|uniref:Uncharacterized protein n=1 Tax=Nocardioides psychrotolerans TaxID=1005945 RepID=A0A1I3LLR6_9ACTN|nr:hypothetical protein [Nocardioides psychrotolerans]GEP38849.1 hypothetical protein NPS01_25120 [Nocardioides psychrotolerans]SFI85416.1 hypothetical protein SAMN05216561_11415 [Nocardioides psychrotolerans]
MSTEQTPEPTDLGHLERTTRWPRHEWEKARSWSSDFEQLLPQLLEIDGPPELVAKSLRASARESGLPVTSPAARRYADALARAAVADARVDALVDLLGVAEFFREQAESEMYAVQSRVDLGGRQIINGTGEAPPDDVHGLLDLADGRCWVFDGTDHDGIAYWIRADSDPRGQTRYAWPIPDTGPFIALMDNWHLGRVNDAAKAWDVTQNALHNILRNLPGYYEEDKSTYIRPDLSSAVARVIQAKDRARFDAVTELRTALDAARGRTPSGFWSQRRWEDWSSELAGLIPEGDESKYSNPEGAQEQIVLDVLKAYIAERAEGGGRA